MNKEEEDLEIMMKDSYLNAKWALARTMKGKNPLFKPPQSLNELHNALKAKNKKFQDMHGSRPNQVEAMNTFFIQYADNPLVSKLKQINQYAAFYNLFSKPHLKTQTQIEEGVYCGPIPEQCLEKPEEIKPPEYKLPADENLVKEFQKRQEKEDSLYMKLMEKGELIQELFEASNDFDFRKSRRILALLLKLLNDQMNHAKKNKATVFDHFNMKEIKKHNQIHLSIPSKLDIMVDLRTGLAASPQFYEDSDIQIMEKFFCGCYFMFLGGQLAKDKLIDILIEQDQKYFAECVRDFFNNCRPQLDNSYLQHAMQAKSIFYRFFVKVLFANEPFTEKQRSLFKNNEKDMLMYLHLKHGNDFVRTQFYQIEKEPHFKNLQKLIECPKESVSERKIQEILLKIINSGDFDDFLDSQLFLNSHHVPSLMLLDTLMFSEDFVMNSIHSKDERADDIVELLLNFVSDVNERNAPIICQLILVMLKKCKFIYDDEHIRKIFVVFAKKNYLLINNPKSVCLTKRHLNMNWKQIEKILLELFYNIRNLRPMAQQYMGFFINFIDLKQYGPVHNTSMKSDKKNRFQNHFQQESLIEDSIPSRKVMSLMNENCQEADIRCKFFTLGLKLLTRDFSNLFISQGELTEKQCWLFSRYFDDTITKTYNFTKNLSLYADLPVIRSQTQEKMLKTTSQNKTTEDKAVSDFVAKTQRILHFCGFLSIMQRAKMCFSYRESPEKTEVVCRQLELTVKNYENETIFMNQMNKNLTWLFLDDFNIGIKLWLQNLWHIDKKLLDESDLTDIHRKTNPDQMQMSTSREFFKQFLQNYFKHTIKSFQ